MAKGTANTAGKNPSAARYTPIEDYGLIGDLHTVALVSKGGSIDHLAFPRFDSPLVFAALLDADKGGRFVIAPSRQSEQIAQKQLYLPNSNVLLSRFLSEEGVAELTDFMPTREGDHRRVVRRLVVVRGEMRFRLLCAPRFDYARAAHRAEACPEGVRFSSRDLSLLLRSSLELSPDGNDAVTDFTLREGESATFVLEEAQDDPAASPAAAEDFAARTFRETLDYWQDWVHEGSYQGLWLEAMRRSALALKLLTYAPEGSIAAAATMGLPEEVGGVRNWDYRYTWVRDASFTVYGLSRLGHMREMNDFVGFIARHTVGGRGSEAPYGSPLQPLYRVDGGQTIPEETVPQLEGYKGSAPVRVGNGAYSQLQLDAYGTLLDSVYIYNKYEPISFGLWLKLREMIDWVCENWHRPDSGIWEVRGGEQAFLYSRLMCWVAVDRGHRLAVARSFPAPLERWREVRDTLYEDIFYGFWNEEVGAFVQRKDSAVIDAACLLMPLVKFISPYDPKFLRTLDAVERTLVNDSLVYRYRNDEAQDGLSGQEGTFSVCSFWYIECLARAGRVDEARLLFEKFLGFANHLGLFSEETDPCGQQLGNFPQAFTHLGLISAAFELNRKLSGDVTAR